MSINKNDWIIWINDQMKDMYKDDGYIELPNNINRIFKTTEDDKDIAMHLLQTFKNIIENENN